VASANRLINRRPLWSIVVTNYSVTSAHDPQMVSANSKSASVMVLLLIVQLGLLKAVKHGVYSLFNT